MAYLKFGIIKVLWSYMKIRKKWWLLPFFVILIPLGLLLIFAQGSAFAPFIYTIF